MPQQSNLRGPVRRSFLNFPVDKQKINLDTRKGEFFLILVKKVLFFKIKFISTLIQNGVIFCCNME